MPWNQGLESAHLNNGHVRLQFTDESEAFGLKLVLGADGAWSKIRSLVNIFTNQKSFANNSRSRWSDQAIPAQCASGVTTRTSTPSTTTPSIQPTQAPQYQLVPMQCWLFKKFPIEATEYISESRLLAPLCSLAASWILRSATGQILQRLRA